MSQLNLSFPEDLKIDLSCKQEKSIEDQFKKIAEELIKNYRIVRIVRNEHNQQSEVCYYFMELEFYYFSPKHPDVITYPRKASAGDWFFHDSGVDICFESNVEVNPKTGKVVSGSDVNAFGGILIRALSKQVGKDHPTYILGPKKCCYELFDTFPAFYSREKGPMKLPTMFPLNFPFIEKFDNLKAVFPSCTRYFDFKKDTIDDKFRKLYKDYWREEKENNGNNKSKKEFKRVEESDFYKEYRGNFQQYLEKEYCFIDDVAFEAYKKDESPKASYIIPHKNDYRLKAKDLVPSKETSSLTK